MTFRQLVKEKYGRDIASYTLTKVNNNEFTRYFSTATTFNQCFSEYEGKNLICYEVDPALKP